MLIVVVHHHRADAGEPQLERLGIGRTHGLNEPEQDFRVAAVGWLHAPFAIGHLYDVYAQSVHVNLFFPQDALFFRSDQ